MPDFGPEFAVYKPTRSGKGGVMRWRLEVQNEAVFLDAARTIGERKFDWENKVSMKWGISDIGEVLAVIEKRVDGAELYHKSPSGVAQFSIKYQRDRTPANYFLSVSRQASEGDDKRPVGVPLTQAEAATLCVLLRAAIVRILKW